MVYSFTESNGRKGKPVRLLRPYLQPYKARIALAFLALAVAAGTVLAFGWGLKQLVDKGFADQTGAYLNQALLALLAVILVLAASSYTRFYNVHWVAERITADLRRRIFEKLLTLDPSWFENSSTGADVSRINADTSVLQLVMAANLPSALRHGLTLIGSVIMLFVVSPVMTGMVMLGVPLIVLPLVYFGRRVRVRSRDTQARVGDISAYGHEVLQGIQTVQSFGYEEPAAEKFGGLADQTFRAALKYIRMRSLLTALVITVVFGAVGVVLWLGGHKVLAGEMTAGELSAFVFYAIMVAGSVGAIGEAMSAFSQAIGAADRITELLSAGSTLSGIAHMDAEIAGAVRFENVSFRYPTRPDVLALDAVSFDVKPGEVVALVGPSGAGKTTIFQLMQRFYDPGEGRVIIDAMNAADYIPEDVRRCMAAVSQDPAIFSVSVMENIRMGKPSATDEEVQQAAVLAQAHDFIMALPEGYDTEVGERGSRLSGGQKQRIAIARAILKDAKILLLDEATSALDSHNEVAVHAALKNLMQDRTTLIIAHRLSTVQNADRIIVMDKGKIVAEGAHGELFGNDSLYTHLAGLQLEARA
ncbi:MAG: ABC transporter transmembrane domain-containing protein [Alphaproteobacteria bacterium]|nr:ABC transporter transmembrane domain-containing protein [Alphaproteobacteria bacterium]